MENMRRPPLPKTIPIKAPHSNSENPERLPRLKLNTKKLPDCFFARMPQMNSSRKIAERIPLLDKNYTEKK